MESSVKGGSKTFKIKYLIRRGWYTFRSSNNWLNNEVMDDMILDSYGLSLEAAFRFQKSRRSVIKKVE